LNRLLELFKNNKEGFVFFDGAFGTMLQREELELGSVPDLVNLTNPEVVEKIMKSYADAGSDIVSTCTFSANSYKLAGSGHTSEEVIKASVNIARKAAAESGAKVALDIGPIGKLLEPNGNLSFEEAYDIFKEQVTAGREADLILIETMTDLYETKAALLAAKENADLPVICSMTFEDNNRTFTGTCISSMALTLDGLGADAIGFNCSLGPEKFKPMVEELSKWTNLPIIVQANAGLPDPSTGKYAITPEEYAGFVADMIPYGIKFIGGCCGTSPDFIRALINAFEGRKYEPQHAVIPSAVCTPEETVVIDQPRIIGERINPTGKKKLKEALKTGDMEYVLSQAADQIKDGAEILDVNAGVPGIDEKAVIVKIVKALQGITSAPLQIDSNNPEVIEAALRVYSGKAIVNSVNGEEKSLASIIPIVKKYGASVVGLTLDDDGIPETAEKRIEIAKKITERAAQAGIEKKDVFIDCLTLTVSAAQENSGNTLKAIRYVKDVMGQKTVLGVSNISFGLPNRPMINHNFLQMALASGLDLPIMNPGAPEMVQAVDVYKLIMNIDKGASAYISKYSEELVPKAAAAKTEKASVKSADELSEIEEAIFTGLTDKCCRLVEKELETREPADIISNTLIPVLDKAGQQFEAGKIFIPQLMLCATTAQAGFEVIKKNIEASGNKGENKGKIVVATVKGDIHDIGKNIVKVILDNYGYEIIDLGRDVDPEAVLYAVTENDVRLVGLSALMTTTLGSMSETIKMIRDKVPDCRVMVGGAVLTADYAKEIGADFYVADAKASVDAAKKIYG